MNGPFRHSLYYRIAIGWLLPITIGLVAFVVVHWQGVYRAFLEEARGRAEQLAVSWNTLRLGNGTQELSGYALELVSRHGLKLLWEVDYRYRIRYSHRPAERLRPVPDSYRGLVAQVLALRTPYWGRSPEGDLLYAYPLWGVEPDVDPQDPVGVLLVEQPRSALRGAFWGYVARSLPLVAGIWLFVVGALMLFTHRRLVRPAERALSLVEALQARRAVEGPAPREPARDELEGLLARLYALAQQWSQAPEAEYGRWFAALPVPVCVLDAELRIREANETLSRWLGLEPAQLRQKPLDQLVAGPDWSGWLEPFGGETPYATAPEPWQLPNGRRAYVLAIGRALPSEGRYLVALVDASEQKRLEHQLRSYADHLEQLIEQRTRELSEAQTFLNNLIETAQVAIFAFDEAGTTQIWNRKAELLTGYSRAEVPSLEVFLEKTAAEPEAIAALSKLFRPAEGHADFQMRLRSRTGRERVLAWSSSRIVDRSRPTGAFVAVGVDVTEAKELQAKLEAQTENLEQLVRARTAELEAKNQQLAALVEELDDFTYIVSHDLQTPLRNILGFISLLGEEQIERLDEHGRELLELIKQSAQRMSRLITDLLELSRIGRTQAPFMEVNLEELVRTLVQEDFPQALAKERPFEIDILTPLPTVWGDPLRLRQVLHNLITNGLKYNRSPLPRVQIGASESENEYIVYVRDNGIGIDPKHHERIFKIFQRLHPQEEFEGTGAGLTICRKIVEQHGGRIWVESALGEGATFYFTLPKERPASV
ncbi:MAG: ATP-binding protein [Bacteroidetes bacterium]|nr:ATP-binding protein [Rhodothermia bacterium]MCS7154981.1 ATP-binding protein [Bacteroidota bacterium]MCX7907265.1 ATP-binding protein [Bacteroidota bacterium]MDW8138009.1 ATP-binding protein [Bacteroidota bacterium]MDW8286139.1 ATP-binding protein [Bacteroidota bacterium]